MKTSTMRLGRWVALSAVAARAVGTGLGAALFAAALAAAADDPSSHTALCATAANVDWCDQARSMFLAQYPAAFARDYQAQRNVAFCFSTGCDGAVVVKKPLGCAWRIVILASGAMEADASDDGNHAADCGARHLDDRGFATAVRQARTLFLEIYGEPLPKAFERR